MSTEASVLNCEECGASIYPEHLEAHKADRFLGRLLCPCCLKEQHKVHGSVPLVADADDSGDLESLSAAAESAPTKRTYNTGGISFERNESAYESLRRPLDPNRPSATRIRTFHAKLTDAALSHLDEMVNEFVDGDDNIQIKFATTHVGILEGKSADPHLIVTIYF